MKTAKEFWREYESERWSAPGLSGNVDEDLDNIEPDIEGTGIFDLMEAYAIEYYNHHKIELKDSDCTCYGDHYGMATNPECIIHGKNRK